MTDTSLTTTTDTNSMDTGVSNPPRFYLVICNIQKLANVKALMKTALAFGCTQVWVVGQAKNQQATQWIPKSFQKALDQDRIQLLQFPKWKDCVDHMTDKGIALVGVEIDASSQVLDSRFDLSNAWSDMKPLASDIAILMGNEGQGIHPKHLESCHGHLLRIPQYGMGTASFNVNVACSIVLYHLQQWKVNQTKKT
eukprot:Nitzschia sp. Nitz4//scaffold3_size479765//471349//471936//NITZ4_000196-RA/size479765-processed-gene-1.503-mRNA-1//1//CDS//3329551046//8983//frame0